jgi:hypothetical protein
LALFEGSFLVNIELEDSLMVYEGVAVRPALALSDVIEDVI